MARLRRPGRARGRSRARGPRGARDAGGDGARSTRTSAPTPASASCCASGSTPARCSRARSATSYTVIGDAGERRRAPPGGRAPRQRHRRRDHPPPHPRRDRVHGARAARAEGQGRAGARPGRRCACSSPAPRGAAPRAATPLIGREDESTLLLSLFDRVVTRGPAAPRHRHRPGRRRQVAAAARADDASSASAPAEAGAPRRPLPRLRRRPRLLGARRGDPRPVRDRRHRRLRGRLGQAQPAGSRRSLAETRPTSRRSAWRR